MALSCALHSSLLLPDIQLVLDRGLEYIYISIRERVDVVIMFCVLLVCLVLFLPDRQTIFNIRAPAPMEGATGKPSLGRTVDVIQYLAPSSVQRAAPPIKESPVPVFRRDDSVPDPVTVEKRGDPDTRRQFNIPAMDCRAPSSIQSIATADTCQGRKRSTQVLSSHQILLLQRIDETVRTGVRCRKFKTTLDLICGSFSHSKLMMPPDVLKPASVTEAECFLAFFIYFKGF